MNVEVNYKCGGDAADCIRKWIAQTTIKCLY